MDIRNRLGRKQDQPDYRDYKLSVPVPKLLPTAADTAKWLTKVENQHSLGSCTGWAGSTYFEMRRRKNGMKKVQFSALALYQFELILNGEFGQDNGAYMRDIFRAAKEYGIPTNDHWTYGPYDAYDVPTKFLKKPIKSVFSDAKNYTIVEYQRLATIEEFKTCIAVAGEPFVIGIPVYESFERIGKDGKMPVPRSGEQLLGGHAVLVWGYDDQDGFFKVRNSWGGNWGDHGNFYIPYTFMKAVDKWGLDAWRALLGRGI